MSANTPKGYTYPVGSDPMSQGNDVMQGLAGQIDTRLGAAHSGSHVFTGFTALETKSVAVTFPVGRFVSGPIPSVQTSPMTTNAQSARTLASGASATGFTLWAYRETGTNDLTVMWVAIQQV